MDEEAIVQRCRNGDIMAYRWLYERYEQPFLRTAARILLNTCYDILRKRGPEQSEDFDKAGLSHQSSVELRHSLEEAIASLPDQMRACFVLFAVEELNQAEIAQILGISLGTVKSTLHWARAKLRNWLAVSGKEVTA